ncbi:hypothetical protein RF11_15018 [Thelohanellus kitauei]|uniref:Uncharacterized protein n=1 Tax=Thelohanellus kitauei TaxID=669202 RepID=A0A0C2MHG8_THEKT|nr:hypothetical protein RF11_15018 [Thelohanellus kitauei]
MVCCHKTSDANVAKRIVISQIQTTARELSNFSCPSKLNKSSFDLKMELKTVYETANVNNETAVSKEILPVVARRPPETTLNLLILYARIAKMVLMVASMNETVNEILVSLKRP